MSDMDVKEIIVQLDKHYQAMRIIASTFTPDEESKRIVKAIKEARKLLERFVQKKPQQQGYGDYCPNCGKSLMWNQYKYCPNCGQAVKWDE